MKILAVTNLFPPHHAGTFDLRCQTVTDALRKRGHQVRVLTSNHGVSTEQRDPEIERRLWLNGVYEHPTLSGFRALKRLELRNHGVLREACAQFKPDLVHVWSLHGLSKSLVFALHRARVPTVYDVADYWLASEVREDPWLRWWNRQPAAFPGNLARACLETIGGRNRLDAEAPTRLQRGYDRLPGFYGPAKALAAVEPNSVSGFRFDRLYFCSQALKSGAEEAGFGVRHAEVIYPGIQAQHFVHELRPQSAPVKQLLVVAHLDGRSGVLTALKGLLAARENGVKATLTVFGRGDSDYVAQLRSFVVTHQLPVEFLTFSDLTRDLRPIYRGHDAVLHTVEWEEPFSLTLLEAMAAGLPVIAARAGAVRELLRHGENALTYHAGDALDLAGRIQELQMQPALRRQMAETAQAEVLANFNETAVVDRIEGYLEASRSTWGEG
ncbi:MAG: glycosyltransferase family 4 protein [Verrucomicrobia bacterium]|nr:glycosyltransferase family 4 protein [Verrucomicrobiota bacterium]